jgi:hypothetical protein
MLLEHYITAFSLLEITNQCIYRYINYIMSIGCYMFRPPIVVIFKEMFFERCTEQFVNPVVRVNKLLLANPSNTTDVTVNE